MPIPTPTTPSATITVTPSSLNPTQNNKAFYAFSGEIGVTDTETTMISVNDIGERDIYLCVQYGSAIASGDDMLIRIKSNGSLIGAHYTSNTYEVYAGDNLDWKFILPANTSLEITMENIISSTSRKQLVSCHGYYMEARLP